MMHLSSGVPTTVVLGHGDTRTGQQMLMSALIMRLTDIPRTMILGARDTGRLWGRGWRARRCHRQCFSYACTVRRDAACPVGQAPHQHHTFAFLEIGEEKGSEVNHT